MQFKQWSKLCSEVSFTVCCSWPLVRANGVDSISLIIIQVLEIHGPSVSVWSETLLLLPIIYISPFTRAELENSWVRVYRLYNLDIYSINHAYLENLLFVTNFFISGLINDLIGMQWISHCRYKSQLKFTSCSPIANFYWLSHKEM